MSKKSKIKRQAQRRAKRQGERQAQGLAQGQATPKGGSCDTEKKLPITTSASAIIALGADTKEPSRIERTYREKYGWFIDWDNVPSVMNQLVALVRARKQLASLAERMSNASLDIAEASCWMDCLSRMKTTVAFSDIHELQEAHETLTQLVNERVTELVQLTEEPTREHTVEDYNELGVVFTPEEPKKTPKTATAPKTAAPKTPKGVNKHTHKNSPSAGVKGKENDNHSDMASEEASQSIQNQTGPKLNSSQELNNTFLASLIRDLEGKKATQQNRISSGQAKGHDEQKVRGLIACLDHSIDGLASLYDTSHLQEQDVIRVVHSNHKSRIERLCQEHMNG